MAAPPLRHPWFPFVRRPSSPSARLICFPFAGSTASAYRRWFDLVPESVEVLPVQLPGRENRWGEKPFRSWEALLPALADALPPMAELPTVFFGHSMGALIAYELTRHLVERGSPLPVHLFASGRAAPHLEPRRANRAQMTDAEFVAELRRLNGTPRAVLDNPELLEIVLPILRGDFALYEAYSPPVDRVPLQVPITAFGGLQDQDVSTRDLEAWASHTDDFRGVHMFPGDHFFLQVQPREVVQRLFADLTGLLAQPRR